MRDASAPHPASRTLKLHVMAHINIKQETGVLLLTKCGVVSAQANQLGDSLASQTGLIVQ